LHTCVLSSVIDLEHCSDWTLVEVLVPMYVKNMLTDKITMELSFAVVIFRMKTE
jgi:hypothetical protein